MSSLITSLNFSGNMAVTTTTPMVDVTAYVSIRSTIFCAANCTTTLNWSSDSVNVDLQETIVSTAGVTVTSSHTIKLKYLSVTYAPAGFPSPVRAQHLFHNGSSSLANLDNVGAGVQLYKNADQKVRTVVSSDSSVVLSQLTDTIDLQVAPSAVTITAANSDVQVTGTAPDYILGVGQPSVSSSYYLTGRDISAKVNVGDTSNTIVGADSGLLNFTTTNHIGNTFIGYQSGRVNATTSGGSYNTSVGYQAGGNLSSSNQYWTTLGYQAGYNSNNSVQNGSICVGLSAGYYDGFGNYGIGIGRLAGYAGSCGDYAIGIGYNACYNGCGRDTIHMGFSAGTTNAPGDYSVGLGRETHLSGGGARAVAVGSFAGQTSQGADSVAIGHLCAQTNQPSRSIAFGANCAVPGAVGRLAFGNTMEAVATTATAGVQTLPANPAGFIKLEWNGTLYKIPVYNN